MLEAKQEIAEVIAMLADKDPSAAMEADVWMQQIERMQALELQRLKDLIDELRAQDAPAPAGLALNLAS